MKKLIKLPFFITLLLSISVNLLYSEESFIPKPPSLNASNYILIDSISGRILAENGADERIEPASITKIMTGYIAVCLLYTSPSPRDGLLSRMPSSA